MDVRKTNYTDDQLSHLIVFSNHNINKIGDYYQWSRYIGNTTEYVDIDFIDKDKVLEYIYYNISLWKKELDERIDKQLTEYQKLQKTKDITNSILTLRSNGIDVKDITYDRIVCHTGMSLSTVKRYISDDDKNTYIHHGKNQHN